MSWIKGHTWITSIKTFVPELAMGIYEVSLGHANARVQQGQPAFLRVGHGFNFHVFTAVQLRRVSQAHIENFSRTVKTHTVTLFLYTVSFIFVS